MNLRWLQKDDGRWVKQTYRQISQDKFGRSTFEWVDIGVCVSCQGTGVSPNQPEGCTDCNGTGEER